MERVTFHYHTALRDRFLENRHEDDPRRPGLSLWDRLKAGPVLPLTREPHANILGSKSCAPIRGEEWSFRYFFYASDERLLPLAVTFKGMPCCAPEKDMQMLAVKFIIQFAAMSCLGYGAYKGAQKLTKNRKVQVVSSVLAFQIASRVLLPLIFECSLPQKWVVRDPKAFQEAVEELQEGVEITAEVTDVLDLLSKRKGEEIPKGITCKNGNWKTGTVFLVDSCPGLVFKRSTSLSETHPTHVSHPDERFFYMILAKYVIKEHNLDHLVVPCARQVEINGETWIVEQKLEVNTHYLHQMRLQFQGGDRVTLALAQLVHFILLTNQADIEWRNNPIMDALEGTDQHRIALLDTDVVETHPTLGLYGSGPEESRSGLMRLMPLRNRHELMSYIREKYKDPVGEERYRELRPDAYIPWWFIQHRNITSPKHLIEAQKIEEIVKRFDERSKPIIRERVTEMVDLLNTHYGTMDDESHKTLWDQREVTYATTIEVEDGLTDDDRRELIEGQREKYEQVFSKMVEVDMICRYAISEASIIEDQGKEEFKITYTLLG